MRAWRSVATLVAATAIGAGLAVAGGESAFAAPAILFDAAPIHDLSDGQTVTFHGGGYREHAVVMVAECLVGQPGQTIENRICTRESDGATDPFVGPDGGISGSITVRKSFLGSNIIDQNFTNVDCRVSRCAIEVLEFTKADFSDARRAALDIDFR